MNKRMAVALAVIVGFIAFSTPIAISIYLAWKQSLRSEFRTATTIAEDVLRRAEDSTGQTLAIFKALQQAGVRDPCSEQNIRTMGRLDLASEQVQAVGFVRGDRLLCSSYGRHDTPIGPAAYTTLYGTLIRPSVEFPILPGVQFLMNTDVKTGYSVAVHPHLPLDVFLNDPEMSVGLFSYSGERVIINRGTFKEEWMRTLGQASAAEFSDGEHLVVIRRSPAYGFAAFAALPASRVTEGLRRISLVLVPIGALAGILLALVVLSLTRHLAAMPAVLAVALRRGEFFLLYQPIVELRLGQCVGAEALIRWRRPNGEMVRPDLFIPVAEETGLIHEITKQVMMLVARDAAELLKQRPGFHIGINLSSIDLQSPDMPQLIREFLASAGIKPSNLLVEATERGFMKADVARRVLNDIRSLNVRVAIDDFGTGYSSLSYLETFKLDYLKIDKAFVDTMGGEAATSQVAVHIIEMAKSLKLEMIAEGVEKAGQVTFLQERGVQYAQGYYFGKPMPIRELAAYVRSTEKATA